MIVIHSSNYNPKIDFLICKQLLSNLPIKYDEILLRKNFYQNCAETPYEKSLLEIKRHFMSHSAENPEKFEPEKLLEIITGEKLDISDFIYTTISNIGDIEKIVRYVNGKGKCIDALFQILLLLCYCQNNEVPLLPYHGSCRSLYYSIIVGDLATAQLKWDRIMQKKEKICNYHDLSLNTQSLVQLKEHKEEFLAKLPNVQLAIYGSLATGHGTNYSDLDLMVIVNEGMDKKDIRHLAYEFWTNKIPIPLDILVTTENEIKLLPIAIQNSLRF